MFAVTYFVIKLLLLELFEYHFAFASSLDYCLASAFFIDNGHYDSSNCPKENWIEDFANYEINTGVRGHVFMNIGFNKGYNFAIFLNLFAPWTGVTPQTWHNSLNKHIIKSDPICGNCGCCEDCTTVFNNVSKLQYSPHEHHKLLFVGVDLNMYNLNMVDNLINDVKSSSTQNLKGVDFFAVHAAGGERSDVIKIPKCDSTNEQCRIPDIKRGFAEETVSIPVVTVDELILELTSKNVSANKFIPFNLHDEHKSYHSKSAAVEGPQIPIVDILIIDTEGHDPLVIKGAQKLIESGRGRCIIFEYHILQPWGSTKLEDVVHYFDSFNYNCYFEGNSRLWPLSGAFWSSFYEFHTWSNVMCVHRADPWHKLAEQYSIFSNGFFTDTINKTMEGAYFLFFVLLRCLVVFNDLKPLYNMHNIEGKVYKYPASRSVFLIENGRKREFQSGQSFLSRGYDFHDVKTPGKAQLDCFPPGAPLY
jgi:hypothetical protein